MRLGLGIGVNRRTPGGQYQFINAQASTYFAALEVAGFTSAQSLSLYSLSFNDIKEAVDVYFQALVTAGVDTELLAIYPLIGGTAATHAINAANPGTFDMTWVASPTHSATGTDFNGTTQYGKTGFIPSVELTIQHVNMSYYSREDSTAIGRAISSRNSNGQLLEGMIRRGGTDQFNCYNNLGGKITFAQSDSRGLFSFIRIAVTDEKIYKNGASEVSGGSSGGSQPTFELYLAARNNLGSATDLNARECAYACLGDGLTATEESDHYDAVQALETTLSRQV